MSEQLQDQTSIKPAAWLSICVGILAQLGLKTVLPIAVLVAIRMWSLETDDKSLWLEQADDAGHPVWYVLQASVFLGSVVAGVLAGFLSPRRSLSVPIALVALSLLATAFEQFPRPATPAVLLIWAVGPCVGLLIGFFLMRAIRGAMP